MSSIESYPDDYYSIYPEALQLTLQNIIQVQQHFTNNFNSCIITNSFTLMLLYTWTFMHILLSMASWTTMYIPCTHVNFAHFILFLYVQCHKWFFYIAHYNSKSWLNPNWKEFQSPSAYLGKVKKYLRSSWMCILNSISVEIVL